MVTPRAQTPTARREPHDSKDWKLGDEASAFKSNEVPILPPTAYDTDMEMYEAWADEVLAGYHDVFPLTEEELEIVFPSLCMRLCVSAVVAEGWPRVASSM